MPQTQIKKFNETKQITMVEMAETQAEMSRMKGKGLLLSFLFAKM